MKDITPNDLPDVVATITRETVAKMVSESGLTYEQLESLTGIPHSTLQRYVAGTTEKIPVNRVIHLASVLRKLAPEAPNTPNDQAPEERSEPMITLNDLLEILDVDKVTLYVHVTPRLTSRIEFHPNQSAEVDDITYHYGGSRVKRVSPVFRGDERVVVELA